MQQQQQQQQLTAQTLQRIFSEVLANLAFMFVDDEPADLPAGALWIETTIGYRGSASGDLRLRCTRDFSGLLAANLLGVDPEDPSAEQKAEDAVKEFMNVVCGQLVTAAHGTDDVFNLTIPELTALTTTPDFGSAEDALKATLTIEDQVIEIAFMEHAQDD